MRLYTGQQIGNWTLLSKLGSGGDGQVWSVKQTDDETIRRAIKLCEPSTNFYQEYELLRTVNIRGVIQVYEYDTFESWVYYIMDLAEGVPFIEHIQRTPSHEQYEECLHLLVSITNILAQLHRRKLMHLDIKSDNLLVSSEGTVTLIDFGKIGFVGDHSTHRKGSHQTMSPEQRSHWHLSPKSDVYSLAVTVYQAFAPNTPYSNIGQPWPSLLNYCKEMEQSFVGFIQQCLHIVPSERPSMDEFHQMVCETQTGSYRSQYFPIAPTYIGNIPNLLGHNCILVGHIGTGRRRILYEHIRLSYLDGIPVFIAKSVPLRPFHVWRDVLNSVLRQFSIQERIQIVQGVEKEMQRLLPEVFPNISPSSIRIGTRSIAEAIRVVLSRCTPITIIVHHLDIADLGSLKIAKYLWSNPIEQLTLWATSLRSYEWSPTVHPPKWTKTNDHQLMSILLSGDLPRHSIAGSNPLQTSIKAWHLTARKRNEPTMIEGTTTQSMWNLGLLKEPFSLRLANLVHPDVKGLIEQDVLEYTTSKEFLRFRFLPFRWMVQQSLMVKDQYQSTHEQLTEAWEIISVRAASHQILFHLSQADLLAPVHLTQALWLAIQRLDYPNIQQWWWLARFHGVRKSNTTRLIGTVLLQLWQNYPIDPKDLQTLEQTTLSASETSVVRYIRFKFELHKANHTIGIKLAEAIVQRSDHELPKYQLMVYADLGELYLSNHSAENCVRMCTYALEQPLTQTFPDVAGQLYFLLATGYLHLCRLREGLQTFSRSLLIPKIPDSVRMNLYSIQGKLQYQLGMRTEARKSWNTHKTDTNTIRTHLTVLEMLRLEVEAGKAQYHQEQLRDVLSVQLPTAVKGNAQALCWEIATQMASSRWVKAGYHLHNVPLSDSGKVALAKWHWLIGNLQEGFELLQSSEQDYDGFHVRVEQVRFGLLLGHFDWCLEAAKILVAQTHWRQFADLQLLLTLCIECVEFNKPAPLLENALEHEWVEIYLGGLHLLAMRKRLRGEDNCDTLELLRRRAQAVNHKLYLALSNPDLYG